MFQKTNEVFINDAHWSVTFVHDLRPFQVLINQIESDLTLTSGAVKSLTNNYVSLNLTGYSETFKSLHVEIDLLTDTYKSVYDNFDEYQSLSDDTQRGKRSLIPLVGQLMSTLFGTVSENELDNINRNIKALASNQEQIIHDLDVSLSVLNLTRMQVSENRRSIMDLIVVVQKLDRKIFNFQQAFSQKFIRLEQFIHTYLQFQMILDEIRLMTQDAIVYLENLRSELNMLSMHHLSTNTISPKDLRKLLIEVESKLPNNFELPRNPRKDIWYFYKTLTCITYLEDNEIRIVLKIPLINTREEYEVYKIHNLPLPIHRVVPNQTDILLKYSLESEMILVSKDKETFALLSESNFQMCNSYHFQFCNPETAFYQANINKFCIVALFKQNAHDIQTNCKQIVVLDQLPTTRYLSYGIWIIVTHIPLTFTVNCQSYEPVTSDIKIVPPFGIIKLNNTCKASNKYLQLPEYFEKHTHFERSDPLKALVKLHDISQLFIWNNSKTEFKKFKPLNLPPHLSGLKEIPMQSFLRETHAYKTVNVEDSQNSHDWTIVIVSLVVSILFILVIVWLVARKYNWPLYQISGRKLANRHDLEGVNVKQAPSKVEDVEMSALIEDKSVSHTQEGQLNSFGQSNRNASTTLAWMHGQNA